MLNAQNICVSYGSKVVLDGVTLTLLPNERVALVGQNGAGKSTLLSVIAGLSPDAGVIEVAGKTTISMLKQTPELDKDQTVLQSVRSGMSELLASISQHQSLCSELSSTADNSAREKIAKKIDYLTHLIEQKGGFDVDYQVERVLSRLGVRSRSQKIASLSGGESRRVDLAKILLAAPDIYLLDEPTNHLDFAGIKFLVETFTKSSAAVLFISHDRAFTDEMATRILELNQGKLYTHEPPFANYLENKLVRELIDGRSLHRRERILVGELAWLRSGTPARTTKQNARIDRAHSLIDKVAKDGAAQREHKLQIERNQAQRLGGTIMELYDVGAAYGERVLFNNLNLKVVKGQRYGILGANGAGKTTLLSIITGLIKPSFGQINFGKNTQTLRFDQHREILDQKATLKETLADHGDFVSIAGKNIHIASYLEKYLFDSGDANRRVATLSGGEQNRLMLAKLFRTEANCLLLDEPTNDLDVESLAVLEELLLDYEGVIFCVSHDRKFLDRICTAVIAFEPNPAGSDIENHIEVNTGNFSDYQNYKAKQEKNTPDKTSSQSKVLLKKSRSESSTRRTFKEEREFEGMASQIENLEAERAALHTEFADPNFFKSSGEKAQEKVERVKVLDSQIAKLYERWEELANKGE